MKISCKKVTSLAMSMLLSVSGGICTGKPVALASSDYFESRTFQNSNDEIVTESAIQIFSLDERSADSVQKGDFTITGEGLIDGTDYSFDETNGVLTIRSSKSMTIRNTNPGTPTNDRIEINLPNNSTETANITLAGVNIEAKAGPAMKIQDGVAFNVNINLADNSENTLTTTASNCAGLQKSYYGIIAVEQLGTLRIDGSGILNAAGGDGGAGIGGGHQGSVSNITISGGEVMANGGVYGAGIGGGYAGSASDITISGGTVMANGGAYGAGIGGGAVVSASNITISGGTVTATGGDFAAGIGGGDQGSASDITISGGTVTATGGGLAAGIGGGNKGSASNITITGGTVTATGGDGGAGIGGGGYNESASNNSINGDAVVIATSGGASKPALEGFDDINKGIVFKRQTESESWRGKMYGDEVRIEEDVTFPADLAIGENKTLAVNSGVTLEIADGAILKNEGTLNNNGTIRCDGSGKVITKLTYNANGGTVSPASEDKTYQDFSGIKTYGTLPTPIKTGYDFGGWYTEPGIKGTKIESSSDVLLNHHTLYARCLGDVHQVVVPTDPESHGTINTDPENPRSGEEVTLIVTPEDGYEIDGLPVVKAGDGTSLEVIPTERANEYKFLMPDSDVTIGAKFVLIPTPMPSPSPSPSPSPEPPTPTPTPTPGGGSAGGFSWNVAGNDNASSIAIPTPTPTDQIGTIGTKTLKDIQSQLPEKVKTIEYIKGYGDGTFKPNNNMTRAEAAQMIYKLLYNGTRVSYDALQKFSDTNQTAWYSTALAYLTNQGFIDGDGGKFYPNRQITRAEMSKILYNALLKYDKDQDKKLAYGTTQFNFIDIPNNWMLEPIKQLATNAMINGYGDGTFKPNNNITSAESVAMIAKVFARSQTYAQRISFSDVSQSHWAYKFIMNAVNGEE